MESHQNNLALRTKYAITARFYDILDYPWERMYKKWRPMLLHNVSGEVLELGAGSGRNFRYYNAGVNLTAIDLSDAMLSRAQKRAQQAACNITLLQLDASLMSDIPSNHYDWVVSTFMCCVMPNELQAQTLQQIHRVLKPGGQFKLLEMVYSTNPTIRRKQAFFAPFVEKVYGARFDRKTLDYLKQTKGLEITNQSYLKDDTYLLLEGEKIRSS